MVVIIANAIKFCKQRCCKPRWTQSKKSCFVAAFAAAVKYQQQSWVNNTGAHNPALQWLQWRQVSFFVLFSSRNTSVVPPLLTHTGRRKQKNQRQRIKKPVCSIAVAIAEEAQIKANTHKQLYSQQRFLDEPLDTVSKKKYNRFMQQKVLGWQTHKYKILMERTLARICSFRGDRPKRHCHSWIYH